jgi:uncharacterized membrane protein
MAFCSNCGAEVQGRFCAKCGTPMSAAAAAPPSGPTPEPASAYTAPPPPPPPPSAPLPPPAAAPQASGLDENMACALCYLLGLLTGVLFLVLEPYNKNRLIRFHAFQSIFLNIAWIAVFIALSIIGIILLPIPFLGPMLSIILHLGASLGVFILWLMLMYKAYNRERWVLPVIGPLAEKQA